MNKIRQPFIHFKTKQTFEDALAAGLIDDDTSVVFIKETQQIFTHGKFYGVSEGDFNLIKDQVDAIEEATSEDITIIINS